MSSIHCRCGAHIGREYPATYDQPADAEWFVDVLKDDTGEAFCSQACFQEVNPIYCVTCGDEPVANAGDECASCASPEVKAEREHFAAYLASEEGCRIMARYSDLMAVQGVARA